MKKTALGLFLVSSIVIGISTLSSADLNNNDYLYSHLWKQENGDITLNWNCHFVNNTYAARIPKSFKVYISPALSSEDFWGNKSFKYREVATVDKAEEYDLDVGDAYYQYDFEDLDKNSFYRFKIEAYYSKDLLCTHYCTDFYEPNHTYNDFSSTMKVSGNTGTISWYRRVSNDATVKIYRSDALKSSKFGYQDVSYTEIGEAAYTDGKFTVNDLKTGENRYYGFVVYEGETPVCTMYREFGTIPAAPEANFTGFWEYPADTNHIQVPFIAADESTEPYMVPDGLIVYRKNKKGKFVEIGRVKLKKNYVDKNVKAGKSYTYKARTYKKIKGKTYYSCYSDEVTLAAVNNYSKAKFRMSFDKNDSSIVKIESLDKYNGKITFLEDSFKIPYTTSYKIVKYSLDGKKWKKTDGSGLPVLKPGKTVFFKLAKKPFRNGIKILVYYGEGLRVDIFSSIWYYDITKETVLDFQVLD